MAALGQRWRTVAPDLPGFGYSATPSPDGLRYTLDEYAEFHKSFVLTLDLQRYVIWPHDYGSQFRFRLALSAPDRLANLIHLREHKPPTLIVWGPHDDYMPEASARAYHRDLPDAPRHLLGGGHWLLETHLNEVVPLVEDFLSHLGESNS